MSSPDGTSTGLRENSLGLAGTLFQSVTYMAPGIGLAISIGIGVQFAGANLPLAVLISLVACAFTAVAIGQLASRIPSAGGLYAYAARGIGPRSGFFIGWLYLGFVLSVAPYLVIQAGWIVDTFVREHTSNFSPTVVPYSLAVVAVVFVLVWFDVRVSARAGIVLGAIEIVIFTVLAVFLVGHGPNSSAPFDPGSSPHGWSGIAQGAVFAILALVGFEAAAALGEESRDPKRIVPIAVVGSTLVIGAYYVLTTYAWNVGAGMDIIGFNAKHPEPWFTLADDRWGSAGSWIVFFALLNSVIACSVAAVNNGARVIFAMGRTGSLPRALGVTHPIHRTPQRATLVVLSALLVVSGIVGLKFGDAVEAFSVTGTLFTILAIVVYIVSCAACVGFFAREGRADRSPLLHVAVPVLGIAAFLLPLYAQFFDLDALFHGTKLFSWVVAYPFTWAAWPALVWLAAGIVLSAVLAATRPEELGSATRAFGGEVT